jgi:hypothetical protein
MPHLVRVTVRKDDYVPGREAHVVVTGSTSDRVSIRHQMEQHQPLAIR